MTSCSCPKMGWRTTALRNRASPRRRFSMNAPSLERWLPLTWGHRALVRSLQVGQESLLTCNTLWRQEREYTERVSFVQAIQKPHKVAVPANHLTSSSGGGYFVIVMLEEEKALFFWHQGNDNVLLDSAAGAVARQRPQRRRDRSLRSGQMPVGLASGTKWARQYGVGLGLRETAADIASIEETTAPATASRRCANSGARGLLRRGNVGVDSGCRVGRHCAPRYRRAGCCTESCLAIAIMVGRGSAIGLGRSRRRCVVVVLVQVGRAPRVVSIRVLHRSLRNVLGLRRRRCGRRLLDRRLGCLRWFGSKLGHRRHRRLGGHASELGLRKV